MLRATLLLIALLSSSAAPACAARAQAAPRASSLSSSSAANGTVDAAARGALPLHLVYEARDVRLPAGRTLKWLISIKAEGKGR